MSDTRLAGIFYWVVRMKRNSISLLLFSLTNVLALSGCAFFGSSSGSNTSAAGKVSVPKVPTVAKPGGDSSSWRYLGTTNDGQLIDEINDSSISSGVSSKNTQVYNFEDRKTVVNPNKFAYPKDQPHFKFLLSHWQMDCNNKEYLLGDATLYNESGVKISSSSYSSDNSVTWLKLGSGTFAEMQYAYICQNKNRNLGY